MICTMCLGAYSGYGQTFTNEEINEFLKRKDKALIIGTNDYDNYPNLINPLPDALAIAEELKTRYDFEIDILENPSLENIYIKLREYALLEYNKYDQFIILFAGHGVYDEVFKEGFLVTTDSRDDDMTFNTYLSHNRLRNIVNNIPCNNILLVIDACFSGTIDPTVAEGGTRNVNPYEEIENLFFVRERLKYKSRKFLTSGGKEYVSDGVRGRHSPFARKLLEALKSEGGKDKILSMAEMLPVMEKISPIPRFGSFGDSEPGGDFLFISNNSQLTATVKEKKIPLVRSQIKKHSISFGATIGSSFSDFTFTGFTLDYQYKKFRIGLGLNSLENQETVRYPLLEGVGGASQINSIAETYPSLNMGYLQNLGPIQVLLGSAIGKVSNHISFQLRTGVELRLWRWFTLGTGYTFQT